jgi:hypothetical protein
MLPSPVSPGNLPGFFSASSVWPPWQSCSCCLVCGILHVTDPPLVGSYDSPATPMCLQGFGFVYVIVGLCPNLCPLPLLVSSPMLTHVTLESLVVFTFCFLCYIGSFGSRLTNTCFQRSCLAVWFLRQIFNTCLYALASIFEKRQSLYWLLLDPRPLVLVHILLMRVVQISH